MQHIYANSCPSVYYVYAYIRHVDSDTARSCSQLFLLTRGFSSCIYKYAHENC